MPLPAPPTLGPPPPSTLGAPPDGGLGVGVLGTDTLGVEGTLGTVTLGTEGTSGTVTLGTEGTSGTVTLGTEGTLGAVIVGRMSVTVPGDTTWWTIETRLSTRSCHLGLFPTSCPQSQRPVFPRYPA